jgi:peptidoglycan-N-acetylglucosamine deacetylase
MKKSLLGLLTFNRILFKRPKARKVLYLTFDDGPNASHTARLLDLLAETGVKATFFVVGRDVVASPELVKRVVAEGHELGNHSLIHPRMDMLSNQARRLEVDGMDRLLATFDDRASHYFRPPYGRVSISLMSFCLRQGYDVAMWSRDSMDYRDEAPLVVKGLTEEPVKNGDIVLFHDDSARASTALGELIPLWKSQGFEFLTLSAGMHS